MFKASTNENGSGSNLDNSSQLLKMEYYKILDNKFPNRAEKVKWIKKVKSSGGSLFSLTKPGQGYARLGMRKQTA